MDTLSASDLRELLSPQEGPCVTVLMPTHVTGPDAQQDTVRLKNLADEVERQLADGWLHSSEAREWAASIRDLAREQTFWENRSRGLAIFITRKSLRKYRLPIEFEELALVNHHFLVRELLPLQNPDYRFLVLTLSQHAIHLFEATEHHIAPINVPGLPQRIEDTLNLDGADPGAQSHSASRAGHGKQSSVFHGQGGVKDTHKDELTLFFRSINEALKPVLREQTLPLVLAGVDYLLPLFRATCHYSHISEAELTGNCDHMHPTQIHAKVWPLIQPLLLKSREQLLDKYRQYAGTEKATDDIRHAITAASQGRIETLFVASDNHLWGTCSPDGQMVEVHESRHNSDEDLLDVVSAQTLLHGGRVISLSSREIPSSGLLAATMRF